LLLLDLSNSCTHDLYMFVLFWEISSLLFSIQKKIEFDLTLYGLKFFIYFIIWGFLIKKIIETQRLVNISVNNWRSIYNSICLFDILIN